MTSDAFQHTGRYCGNDCDSNRVHGDSESTVSVSQPLLGGVISVINYVTLQKRQRGWWIYDTSQQPLGLILVTINLFAYNCVYNIA